MSFPTAPSYGFFENLTEDQEQFMDICNKVFGISCSMADYYRREISKKKKENLVPLKETIMKKFPKKAKNFLLIFIRLFRMQ